MSATKCDNCGYISKEYDEEREEACPFCDGGKMMPLEDEKDAVAKLQLQRGVMRLDELSMDCIAMMGEIAAVGGVKMAGYDKAMAAIVSLRSAIIEMRGA